ncbi:PadR family transcriptional regulator [Intrasporangium oryzae NRRL B-24470]|uniref:PadR family transcriptional regulator n=1 Tax=Intrasporangium oryzae NRRL B-24470 TaxID=1386089 RepID=W9GB45_9MICO|nr:PadR family transcriptional regulator [Intrasporangium oryzae]EWT02028.1 PadR family transcriptional regulator [Intrasporangium oryzae NRRL B-24470]
MPSSSRPTSRRAALLEFAILGLLHDGALHGYELRKRLTTALGIFRALSYGSLYPALRNLVEAGFIHETSEPAGTSSLGTAKRPRITYELTADGKEHFQDLVAASGPDAWDDDDFDVRFAFFSRTEAQVRLRILEGRRSRLEERLANVREASIRNRERMDSYTLALQQHGEERAEREVRWLEELISAERRAALDPGPAAYDTPVAPPEQTHTSQTQPSQTQPNNKE